MLAPNITPDPTPNELPPPEKANNRTFMIAVGILGGLVFITIICLLLYAFILGPRLAASNGNAQATAEAHNLQIAQAMTATMNAVMATPSATATQVPKATETPSPTPVVYIPTQTATTVYDSLTATMEALYTQAAMAQLTPTSTLVSPEGSLPEGGFADEYGLPGLIIAAAGLVIVILLARHLRSAA